ncbi:MAG: TetR/AcrR family transcriptional regulator, partial [Anaerolineales bacterium]
VTKAALYYHFKDKESLFLAILETYLEKIENLIADIEAESISSRERIRLLVTRVLNQPVDQRAVIRLASQEMANLSADSRRSFGEIYHQRFIGRIQTMLETGINEGELRTVDPQVATWTLLGMMYPYFYPVHSNDVSLSPDKIDQLVDLYLNGVAVPIE